MTEPAADRPEVDDPRVLALAQARQQLAYENPFNAVCPPWDGLSEQEQRLSLLDARSYLHAALKAGLAPAAVPVPPPTDQSALRDRIRRAVLLEAAEAVQSSDVEYNTAAAEAALKNGGPFALIAYVQLAIGEHLRRLAAEAPSSRDETAASLARVRALHVPTAEGNCRECQASFDPCPTIAALDGGTSFGPDEGVYGRDPFYAAAEAPTTTKPETEAHPPEHTWKVESPRRDRWASWGATHDERVWAAASYEDVIAVAPQRAFRLVRATTTYVVEAEHAPAAETQDAPSVETCPPGCVACATAESHDPQPAAGVRQDGTQPQDPFCICSHPRSRHLKVSGRLLCDECDPDSTDHLVCKEFEAL